MKKWGIIITTLLMAGGLLLFGGCRHGHKDDQAHVDFVIDYLGEVLDLDQAQQEKLEKIRMELTPRIAALRDARQKMHPMVKEQLAAERIDTGAVKEAIGEHRRQLDQVIDLAVDRFAEFHAILTPEQRQKLIAKLEKMEKWHNYQETK